MLLILNTANTNANAKYVEVLYIINHLMVIKMQKRCIGCNVVIGHKKHYCYRCLTELTEKVKKYE
tara:strand:+ start:4347 stop:4541 length:195 start_codon:yes stop_codon:yes gene_type:complete